MGAAAMPAARERGWGPTVAALAACLAIAAAPVWPAAAGLAAAFVRALVPIEQTMLLVVPAVAALAIVGWWAGGKPFLALAWVALAVWVIRQPLPAGGGAYATLARGWSLTHTADGRLVRSPDDAPAGTALVTTVEGGEVRSTAT